MTPTTEQLAAELDELAPHLALGPNQSATLRAAAARLRELEAALKPFGEASRDCDDPDIHDGVDAWESPEAMHVCIRDFRRAAQLTETHSEP